MGPSTELWGTTDVALNVLEKVGPNLTQIVLLVRKFEMKLRIFPSMTYDINFKRILWCGTESNDFSKSKYITSFGISCSIVSDKH